MPPNEPSATDSASTEVPRPEGLPSRRLRRIWPTFFNIVWMVAFAVALVATTLGFQAGQGLHQVDPGPNARVIDSISAKASAKANALMPQLRGPSPAQVGSAAVPVENRLRIADGLSVLGKIAETAPPFLLIVGAMVLRRSGGRDKLAALLSLSFLLVASSNFVSTSFWSEAGWERLGFLMDNAGWVGIFLVLILSPRGRFEPRWLFALPALLLPFWIYDLVSPWIDDLVSPFSQNAKILLHAGTFAIGVLIAGLRYRNSASADRRQLGWFLAGFAAGTLSIAGGLAIEVLAGQAAASPAKMVSYALFSAGVCAYVGGLLMATLKYGLYDSDALLTRSAAYSALILFGGVVYAAGSAVLDPLFEDLFGGSMGWKVATPILAVAVVAPIRKSFESWADQRFRKQLIDLQSKLPEEIADLGEYVSCEELLQEVLVRIERDVGAARAAVLLDRIPAAVRHVSVKDARDWQDRKLPPAAARIALCEPDDSLFPVRVPLSLRQTSEAPPMGWILVGPRQNGNLFGADEREALLALSEPVARAVTMIGMREEEEAKLGSMQDALSRLLQKVSGTNTGSPSPPRNSRPRSR